MKIKMIKLLFMNKRKRKRILFFTASFMGFQFDIKECLEKHGAQVDWFDERMSDKTLNKIIVRIGRDALSRKINKYYCKILDKIKDRKYDYVLFVNIEAATSSIIIKYRNCFKSAKFILYEWDSIRNNKTRRTIWRCLTQYGHLTRMTVMIMKLIFFHSFIWIVIHY